MRDPWGKGWAEAMAGDSSSHSYERRRGMTCSRVRIVISLHAEKYVPVALGLALEATDPLNGICTFANHARLWLAVAAGNLAAFFATVALNELELWAGLAGSCVTFCNTAMLATVE